MIVKEVVLVGEEEEVEDSVVVVEAEGALDRETMTVSDSVNIILRKPVHYSICMIRFKDFFLYIRFLICAALMWPNLAFLVHIHIV